MSRHRNLGFRSPALLIASLAIIGGSMVVWNVAVSSASAPRATVSSAKVSHYLCYSVNEVANSAAPGFAKTPTSVILKNGLQASPFLATLTTPAGAPGTPDVHCNPALKVTQKGKYPILNKNAHLLCWTIGTKATKGSVTVTNQFGSGVFDYANANQLCLPTWKSLTGPPKEKTVAPPGLDHYACYPGEPTTATAFAAPPGLAVEDQFSPRLIPVQVGTAQELCVPTTKTVAKTVYKANFKDPSLLCFQVTRTPFKSPIYDLNQFGTGTLGVQGTRWLCLPSKLAPVVNPPISHFLCYKVGIQVISTPWPKTVTLSNFLQPTPTAFAISPDQLVHCNPAEKMVPKATYAIVNPNGHLLCAGVKQTGKGAPSTSAIVANQFGHGTVRIGPAQYLCLPSWKSLTAPPVEPVSAPPGLDHFTCYPVAGTTKGFSFPSPVKVQDEFAAAPVTVRLGRAGALCVPTTKTVNGATTKANFNDPSLLCFAVSKTPIVTPVFDLNQFGNETVNVQLTQSLCVPSKTTR